MRKNISSERGFTLVELLIVIVIIGILAGILISVINPAQQQRKARDGVLVATLNKIVLEIKASAGSDVTGVGSFPTCANLVSSLGNAGACGGAGNAQFSITGVLNQGGAPATFRYVPNAAVGFCLTVALATTPADVMTMTQATAQPVRSTATIAAACP